VKDADLVVSMRARSSALGLALGEAGFVDAMRRDAVHVSMSTVSPAATRSLRAAHEARGTWLVAATALGPIPDSHPETSLQGDADAILHRIQQYIEAGVDRVVIEPLSNDLDDFLRQIAGFADEITPHVARTSALR
jgi:chemotaxis regulatin CheY-phosphate phosphatase CheZ